MTIKKPSTLTDIAKEAGVSLITASRALRGVGRVAQETRQRVAEVAARLDYTPDMLAQKMRGASSNIIGVIVSSFGSLFVQELLAAINEEADRQGFDLVIFNSKRFNDPRRTGTTEMLRKLCDGLLVLLPSADDELLAKLEQAQAPCVLVNFNARAVDLPVITVANRAAARQATEHLLTLGHTKIAFICGASHTGQSEERRKGYEDALLAAGIAVNPAWIVQGEFTEATGFRQTRALLALPDRPTAIFAANDAMAFGALDAIAAAGLKAPEDLSVLGFDDVARANFVHPKLTTLRQPMDEIASRSVDELIKAIKRGASSGGFRLELPTRLMVRESTGPAPTR